jgi:hypothetical protein
MDEYLDDLLPDDVDEVAPETEQEILEEKMAAIDAPLKLDYKLTDINDRVALVDKIIAATPKEKLTNRYLEYLGDYIM